MIDPSRYADRRFNLQTYNCAHFVREVWLDHCGVDLGDFVPNPMTFAAARRAFGRHEQDVVGARIVELRTPEEPCLVLINYRAKMPHCGILVDGNLLHLAKSGKVCHEPLNIEPGMQVRYFR